MSAAARVDAPWRVRVYSANKARAATRIWVIGPGRQSIGWFPSVEAAQAEADKQNAKAAQASNP